MPTRLYKTVRLTGHAPPARLGGHAPPVMLAKALLLVMLAKAASMLPVKPIPPTQGSANATYVPPLGAPFFPPPHAITMYCLPFTM